MDKSSLQARHPRQRVIRVFVSSTFRDMQAEREELIKRTFPQLRKLCESRSVAWSEVDLRWGVTDEQKAEGQVLSICLDEIRRCRPFFIGLLGERYGWVLDVIDISVLAHEPWLAKYRGRSVTEIEMVSGVLENPEMADHAFFYFRDPPASAAVAETLPPETSSEEAATKLSELKTRIRHSLLPLNERFRSPTELGEMILADFSGLIDRLYPQDETPNPLDREALLHDTFAALRAQVYVGRQDYFERLDEHAGGDGPPLAILGDSGLGKSALLANWVAAYRAAHQETFVFAHFIGASPASADWTALARRLIGELNRHFGLALAVPDEPLALRQAFDVALRTTGAVHRLVIVLDALNQLDDREQAPDLPWLPCDLLPRVRVIASTLPGRSLDEIVRRGWPTLTISPLQRDEREHLIEDYLHRYAKALDVPQVLRIVDAPLSGNPLFLTALLEELRVWGVYETLDDCISNYVTSPDIQELFRRILTRYETDYESERPGLVRDAFSAIWSARNGLSEAELLDLLGDGGAPLPHAFWSPLFLAAERSLVDHSGLLNFFHDYLRQAVRERYLPDQEQQDNAHRRLADYFAPRTLTDRKTAELPWQLSQAKDWQRLADTLADLPLIAAAMRQNAFDVYGYWISITEHIPDAALKAYQPVFDDPQRHMEYMWQVALLLLRLNFTTQAGTLQSYMFQLLEQLPQFEPAGFAQLAVQTATTYRAAGDLDAALRTILMAINVARRYDEHAWLATAIANQATFLYEQGSVDEAAALFAQAEGLARELKENTLLGDVLQNHVNIVSKTNPKEALGILSEVERLARETGNMDGLSACFGNQGYAYLRLGELDEALTKFNRQEQTSTEIGLLQGVQGALCGQALVFASRGDDAGALERLMREATLCRRLGSKKKLAQSLLLQASLYAKQGKDIDLGIGVAREHESLCREIGDEGDLARGLMVQANLYEAKGDRIASLGALQKAEAIFRKLMEKKNLADCLAFEAPRFEANGNGGQATRALKEAEGLYREVEDPAGEARALFNRARLFFLMTRMAAAAMPDMRRAQAIADDHGLVALAQEIKQYADALDQSAH